MLPTGKRSNLKGPAPCSALFSCSPPPPSPSPPSPATPSPRATNKKGFAIFDNDGEKIFDDGKLDGKGCVVGKQAVFDKATGGIKVVNAAKCNF